VTKRGKRAKRRDGKKKLGSYEEGCLYPREMRHEISKIIGKLTSHLGRAAECFSTTAGLKGSV